MTTWREKLIKMGAKLVRHGRFVMIQVGGILERHRYLLMAEAVATKDIRYNPTLEEFEPNDALHPLHRKTCQSRRDRT